jgi:glycosyltransferase involved in cell wall biosynthesis
MSVSVIIPTHDRARRVVVAVQSVLAQTTAALEVIVVDDGSTDETAAALAPCGDRIRIERRRHAGVSAARNHGARVARGEWLAFLDSDDEWLPEKLERQVAFHDAHEGVEVSQTGEIWIRNGVRVNPCKHHAKPRGDIFERSLARCLVSPSAVMMRRSLFVDAGGFDESLPVCEDYDLWLRLAARQSFGLIDDALVVKHGGHGDQLSARYWGMDRFRIRALSRLIAAGQLNPVQRGAAVAMLARKCAVLARGARKRGRLEDAAHYESLAVQHADD